MAFDNKSGLTDKYGLVRGRQIPTGDPTRIVPDLLHPVFGEFVRVPGFKTERILAGRVDTWLNRGKTLIPQELGVIFRSSNLIEPSAAQARVVGVAKMTSD
jgi:hypothetical protein